VELKGLLSRLDSLIPVLILVPDVDFVFSETTARVSEGNGSVTTDGRW